MSVDLADLVESNPHVRGGRKRLSPALRQQLADEFQRGDPIQEIADRHGVSYNTVRNTAHRYGVPPRPAGGKWKDPTSEQIEQILSMWSEGFPISWIGRKLDLGKYNVARLLAERGIQRTDVVFRRRGKYSGNWKGGRRPAPGGYIYCHVVETDQYAVMRQSAGYVLEHRLVMAQHLGRPLTPQETVHHINGDKTDNRLENLQLRIGGHGPHIALQCRTCGSCDVGPAPLKEVSPSP